jgi:hypothetical protein
MALGSADAESWVVEGPLEERIVSYADKRATQRVVSMEHRFERWRRRHPEHLDELARAFVLARRLEVELCEIIAIRPDAVERLRWVEQAMDRAALNGRLATPTEGEAAARQPADRQLGRA